MTQFYEPTDDPEVYQLAHRPNRYDFNRCREFSRGMIDATAAWIIEKDGSIYLQGYAWAQDGNWYVSEKEIYG